LAGLLLKITTMKKQNRRKFIALAVMSGTGFTTIASACAAEKARQPITHHVFFWLKNPQSKEDLNKLLDGLRTLKKIETVRQIHIGVPASTEKRDVVETTYQASELLFFDDLAGQKTYQDHPIHLRFVESCSHLWEKVIVYDSVDV
jgi:hypothetical protein